MADWVVDFQVLCEVFGIEQYYIVGYLLGGVFLFLFIVEEGEWVLLVILVVLGFFFGFGGMKDEKGIFNYVDFVGLGGGIVNFEFVKLMGEKDKSSDNL